jgi:hypothetical protein
MQTEGSILLVIDRLGHVLDVACYPVENDAQKAAEETIKTASAAGVTSGMRVVVVDGRLFEASK